MQDFQFTASYEADRLAIIMSPHYTPFNSQPHTRLTVGSYMFHLLLHLSIHSLIRGWPCGNPSYNSITSLSIHSLIRGWPCNTLNQFQEMELSIHSLIRGWPVIRLWCIKILNLSIHSLIRGWPYKFCTLRYSFIFQFTASYEADRIIMSRRLLNLIFQFTASYEADLSSSRYEIPSTHTFNSQPHTRLTSLQMLRAWSMGTFNSQPHTRLTNLWMLLNG